MHATNGQYVGIIVEYRVMYRPSRGGAGSPWFSPELSRVGNAMIHDSEAKNSILRPKGPDSIELVALRLQPATNCGMRPHNLETNHGRFVKRRSEGVKRKVR